MSNYKRICTPIVTYKYDRNGWNIYNISIITHKNHRINLYHCSDENCMILDTKNSALEFVNNLCKMNGFRTKIVSKDFGMDWYNILWINADTNRDEMYGLSRL